MTPPGNDSARPRSGSTAPGVNPSFVIAALCLVAGLALLVAGHPAGLGWVLVVLGLAVAARAHALGEGDRR